VFTSGGGSTTATLDSASSTLVPASIRERIGTRVPVVGVVLILWRCPLHAPRHSATAVSAVSASARRDSEGVVVPSGTRFESMIVS
jgi:hypothetical protein